MIIIGRKKKQMTIPEIIDNICALEAYEEFLEKELHYNYHPFKRKEYRNALTNTRRQLTEFRLLLNNA